MRRTLRALASVGLAAFLPACGMPMGPYKAEARDTWKHTYSISKDGEVSIFNVNGRIDVEGTDGSTVEVEAERIAHAATDQLANDLLPKIPINDRSTPDLVHVETGRINGILIGASFEVHYHVKAPKGATVKATTVNGAVDVKSLTGRTVARTTNGRVNAEKISGKLEAATVNGGVRARFDALGPGDITLGVVNGSVRVWLPPTARATLNATWVNGGLNTSGLTFQSKDSGKRHFEGTLNGGGTTINAKTVNGGITVSALGADSGADNDEDEGSGKELKQLKGKNDIAP